MAAPEKSRSRMSARIAGKISEDVHPFTPVPEPIEDIPRPPVARRRKGRRLIRFFFKLILICAVGLLAYGYYLKDKELRMVNDPAYKSEVSKKEDAEIIKKVSKLALLPEGKTPQIITVRDADLAMAQQPNLKNVVSGDKILIYPDEQMAVIYSPSRNVIVTILPINLKAASSSPSTSSSLQAQPVSSTSTVLSATASSSKKQSSASSTRATSSAPRTSTRQR